MAKMLDYGDRVQFSLITGGAEPGYQVMNPEGKKMAFDGNHHLLRPEGEEFTGVNASAHFSLDQVKAAIAGLRATSGAASKTRAVRATGTGGRTSAAKLDEQFASQRYEYFKSNRQTLPPKISEHTEEITELMKKGTPVEEAFSEVVKKYF